MHNFHGHKITHGQISILWMKPVIERADCLLVRPLGNILVDRFQT